MNQCVTVDPVLLWAGLKEGLLASALTFLFVGGLIGLSGWKRPTRMAWLHNKLMFGLILLGTLPASFLFIFGSLLKGIHVQEQCLDEGLWWLLAPDAAANIIFAIGMLGLIIGSVYFFKTVRPDFLVKKTGNAVVDATIARYRQSGERVVVGRPRLVVDGAGYYQAVYIQGEGPDALAEPLLVREDGQMVRDEALARRVLTVGDAAFELGEPDALYQRHELYRRISKLKRELEAHEWLREKREKHLAERYPRVRPIYETLMDSVEIFLEYLRRLQGDLEQQAEWSWEKGGPKITMLSEKEVETMEKNLEAIRYWWKDEERLQVLERGAEAARQLVDMLKAEEGDGAQMRNEDGASWWTLWEISEPWVGSYGRVWKHSGKKAEGIGAVVFGPGFRKDMGFMGKKRNWLRSEKVRKGQLEALTKKNSLQGGANKLTKRQVRYFQVGVNCW